LNFQFQATWIKRGYNNVWLALPSYSGCGPN